MSENVSVNVVPQYHLEYSIRDIDSLQAAINAPYESIELWHDQINSYKKILNTSVPIPINFTVLKHDLTSIFLSLSMPRELERGPYGTVPYNTIHRKSEKH